MGDAVCTADRSALDWRETLPLEGAFASSMGEEAGGAMAPQLSQLQVESNVLESTYACLFCRNRRRCSLSSYQIISGMLWSKCYLMPSRLLAYRKSDQMTVLTTSEHDLGQVTWRLIQRFGRIGCFLG